MQFVEVVDPVLSVVKPSGQGEQAISFCDSLKYPTPHGLQDSFALSSVPGGHPTKMETVHYLKI